MGKKRQSEVQRLVAFAMTVSEEELNQVTEVIQAIKDSRFPRAAPKAPRKPRSDSGTKRGLPSKDESAKSNGGDADVQP